MLKTTCADSKKPTQSRTEIRGSEDVSCCIGGLIVNPIAHNINALDLTTRNNVVDSFSGLNFEKDAKADTICSASRDLLQMRKVEEELQVIEKTQSRQPGIHNEGTFEAPPGRFEQLHEDLLQYTSRKTSKCTRRNRFKKQKNKVRAEAYEGKQINRMKQKLSKKVTRRKTYHSC
uniref:AlNc14C33G3043 protein n=1 Tax=Albugo laibachii Nc14 TaxID=890382 RepID=F0W883_9STRA|nr:AlNc14C33G3043 [Albugo laibachii Nc14]|eukprot:CCA17367.1 AlNc14C33G3043 [Albugo laibachii Nc14]